MAVKKWQDAPEQDWPDILELIDPDWTDHFHWPEQGLEFYEKWSDKYIIPDPVVANAVQEFYGEDG